MKSDDGGEGAVQLHKNGAAAHDRLRAASSQLSVTLPDDGKARRCRSDRHIPDAEDRGWVPYPERLQQAKLFDARSKITDWRKEYNEVRPHSSLDYRTPNEFAQAIKKASYGKDAGSACLENASGVSHFATAPATG